MITPRLIVLLLVLSLNMNLKAQNPQFKFQEQELLDSLKRLNISELLQKSSTLSQRKFVRQAKVVFTTDTLKYVHKQKFGMEREMVRYKTDRVYIKYFTVNGMVVSAKIQTKNFNTKKLKTVYYFRNKAIITKYRVGRLVEKGRVNQYVLNF